jgi:hypothetical protein
VKRHAYWIAGVLLLAAAVLPMAAAQQNGDVTPMTLEQRVAMMKAQNEKLKQRLVAMETIVDDHVVANEQARVRIEAAGILLRELAVRIVTPPAAANGEKE